MKDARTSPRKSRKRWPNRKWCDGEGALETRNLKFPEQFKQQHLSLKHHSPLEMLMLYLDNEIKELFVNYANKALTQKNLRRFLIILTLSSCNADNFWSKDGDVSCSIIVQLMRRNHFELLKRMIHVCDNNNLDPDDKWFSLQVVTSFHHSREL